MLVKYLGLDNDLFPRNKFISNSLFRMTQPKYLNDKSEAKLLAYFNKFSPADYEWANKEYYKFQVDHSFTPTINELEELYLKPVTPRYGDSYPHMLYQEGFESMDEYDNKTFNHIIKQINTFLVEMLSCHLGVFSLSKSNNNKLMWTHYANDGKGLAVTFNASNTFFEQFPPKDISYIEGKRASFTYYKDMVRLNGIPLNRLHVNNTTNPSDIIQFLHSEGLNIDELVDRLLYSKDEIWSYENEVRIVCPLTSCEEKAGGIISPQFEIDIPHNLSRKIGSYSEINLKKIPFDSFESIILGYNMQKSHKLKITELVIENAELSHVKLLEARHDIYGNIEIVNWEHS